MDWVKEQEFFKPDRFLISEPEDKYADGSFTPYADLCLMSLCSHAIIANSSMSWWVLGYKIDTGKIVAPNPWYGAKAYNYGNAELCDADLIPERWTKLYNDPTPIDIVK